MIGGIFGESEKIDEFSSVKVLRKVRDGLKEAVGEVFLLVKPEYSGSCFGSTSVERYTSRTCNLGVLSDVPSVSSLKERDAFSSISSRDNSREGDLLTDIILPVSAGYISNFSNLKEGPIGFRRRNADEVNISDSYFLDREGGISIYVGEKAVEEYVGLDVVRYFTSMNRLGASVSDEFYSKNKDRIEGEKSLFLDDLRESIAKSLLDEDSVTKKEWGRFYNSISGWKVEEQILKLDNKINIPPIGGYVKDKL